MRVVQADDGRNGCSAIFAGAASASGLETAYENLNTVPATVNGSPNTDTYSFDFEYFPMGGQVELAKTAVRVIKNVSTQLDSFVCEHGVYSLEKSCLTLKSHKKFSMTWTAGIYEVGPGNSVGARLSSSTETFKLLFRPTTNESCPATVEGKGYGPNCDVGGFLNRVTFKRFHPAVSLPEKVIILLTNSCGGCSGMPVNVGLQASYKEFTGGSFVAEPPTGGGVPAVGTDPIDEYVYLNGELVGPGHKRDGEPEESFKEFQPVCKVEVISHH
jgi:hypothetical protein